ncbi:MAG: DNA polymerase III subunit alpha [Candidatus Pacebacteria bacterium]|nr:DNA polymerase III subunit alpha [Candidatus Paceibacterota bacterium]
MYFTHLHVHSHYSLLDGLAQPENLLKQAKKKGLKAVALTDHGVMYGAIEFYTLAQEMGIKPIIGCEFYLAPASLYDKAQKQDIKFYHLILLAKNQTGYENLLKLVSIGELEGFYYKPRIDKTVLKKHSEGLIALSACARGEIPSALLANNYEKAVQLAKEYEEIFGKGNFYLELQHHPELPDQKIINEGLLKIADEYKIPAVITTDVHYIQKEDKKVQDVLLAIQTGSAMEDEDRFTMQKADLYFKSPEEIIKDFSHRPDLFENIERIVNQCNLELELGKVILPYFKTTNGEDSYQYLEKLALKNFKEFYSDKDTKAKKRFFYELEVIKKTGFADYFLIIQDFIQFAKKQGILTNTRGSAAGSLVAYVLGITSVDPIKYDLFFERFLNPERIQPPDIDIDIADDRRAELINYITEKYGKDHVAQIITFGIMKSRLAVRDVTRALGYSYSLGDQIAKLIPFDYPIDKALKTIPELKQLVDTNSEAREVIEMAQQLEGVARHGSTHAAGVVISREPLVNYSPLQHSSRNDKEVITQYDMYSLEKIGLLKMDILGLANLTIIKNAIRIIKKVYEKDIKIEEIKYDDPKVYQLLASGNSIGLFQVESGGMRRYLQELKPTQFEDIIAMLALYRPGPMELIPQFINRKHGREKIVYLHPKLEPILKNTYGVCAYQEQLMQIAHDLAGFSMAQADVLRKAVGKKIKSLLEAQKEQMIEGMVKNKIARATAEKIWNWVIPFARYGFNKSHATSYARITYLTAWLKAYYPNAFMAALLTSDFGNLDRIAIEINECKRLKIKVNPPSVNTSFAEFGIDKKTGDIFFSLAAIKNVGEGVALIIQEERQKNGEFKNLTDFLKRIPRQSLNKKTLESLIKAGALDCFGERELMADHLEEILNWNVQFNNSRNNHQMALFQEEAGDELLERLKKKFPQTLVDKERRMNWEKEYLGLYLTSHPLDNYKNVLGKIALTATQLNPCYLGKKIKVCGFISKIQQVRTKVGKPMVFTRLADYDNSIEVVLYPAILNSYGDILREDRVLLVEGRMDKRNGSYQIIGEKLEEIKPLEA